MSLTKTLGTTKRPLHSNESQPLKYDGDDRIQQSPEHQSMTKLQTERSLSSDDTVFLNLPNSINRIERSIPKDAYMLSRMIDFVDSTPSPTTKNGSTSVTPTPTTSRDTTPTVFIDNQSPWSSSDEDTSFYKDRTPMTCSEFQTPEYRCGDRHISSKYCNSIRGGYQTETICYLTFLFYLFFFFCNFAKFTFHEKKNIEKQREREKESE